MTPDKETTDCRGCNGLGEVGSPNPEIGTDRCPFCKGSGVETTGEASKTPITDKAEYEVRLGRHKRKVVRPELCRSLETQLTAAQAHNKRVAKWLEITSNEKLELVDQVDSLCAEKAAAQAVMEQLAEALVAFRDRDLSVDLEELADSALAAYKALTPQ